MTVETLSDVACFGGRQLRLQHASEALSCAMTFSVYLPPQAREHAVPVVYWLSGLTCTDENFVTKAGAQRGAARGWPWWLNTSPETRCLMIPRSLRFRLGAGST